jgi:hypothetical protein
MFAASPVPDFDPSGRARYGDDARNNKSPRFYLWHFATGEKCVDLFNIPSARLIRGAPLKGQCCRDSFYGEERRAREEPCRGRGADSAPVPHHVRVAAVAVSVVVEVAFVDEVAQVAYSGERDRRFRRIVTAVTA